MAAAPDMASDNPFAGNWKVSCGVVHPFTSIIRETIIITLASEVLRSFLLRKQMSTSERYEFKKCSSTIIPVIGVERKGANS